MNKKNILIGIAVVLGIAVILYLYKRNKTTSPSTIDAEVLQAK
jgi:hypothetical protein